MLPVSWPDGRTAQRALVILGLKRWIILPLSQLLGGVGACPMIAPRQFQAVSPRGPNGTQSDADAVSEVTLGTRVARAVRVRDPPLECLDL